MDCDIRACDEYDAHLHEMVSCGMTTGEIAEDLGKSKAAVAGALSRRGLKIHGRGKVKDYRAQIQTMRRADAEQFLLDAIEQLLGIDDKLTPLQRWGFHLGWRQERILLALDRRAPRVISGYDLYTVAYFDSDEHDDPRNLVSVHIHNIRKAMPVHFGRVETEVNLGYWLNRSAG